MVHWYDCMITRTILLCRDGGGCLYTVIQWKTAASVLQSENWANRTVEANVRTIYTEDNDNKCRQM